MTLKSHHLLTVLVVDDDPYIRAMLYRLLTLEGYHVLEAADGVAALDVLAGPHRHQFSQIQGVFQLFQKYRFDFRAFRGIPKICSH